jgi:hypothetical protein
LIHRRANSGSVVFANCTFNKQVEVQYENSSFDENCAFNENLTIHIQKYEHTNEISNLNVKGILEINGEAQHLTLKNINQSYNIENQKLKINCRCNGLHITEVKAMKLEFPNSAKFEEKFSISSINVGELSIGDVILDTEIRIFKSRIKSFQIGNVSGSRREVTITESIIEEIPFEIRLLRKQAIISSTIGKFTLSGSNEKESIVEIIKTTITELRFDNIYNNGLMTLRELSTPLNGVVSFKSSNLGKTDFIYCDFSKGMLEFENCKVTEAFFSDTEFPKKVVINGIENFGQAQLAFGQLAYAYQKQGDNIRSLEYLSREVEAHYKNIRWLSHDFFQKLNLWLNKVSNDFGRNWVRGGIFSFIVGLIFFCLLLISTSGYSWGWPHLDFSLLPAYLKFMNPLRFFELEQLFNNTPKEEIKLSSLSYLADFGGRIFVAYGYYQTIQAFRRFGRK